MIVVAIIGVLAAIAAPSFWQHLSTIRKNLCVNNLRQISAAKDKWALDSSASEDAEPTAADLDDYLKGGSEAIFCKADPDASFATSYTANAVDENPTCNIDGTHTL